MCFLKYVNPHLLYINGITTKYIKIEGLLVVVTPVVVVVATEVVLPVVVVELGVVVVPEDADVVVIVIVGVVAKKYERTHCKLKEINTFFDNVTDSN